jgi:hypothetical protein
VPPCDGVCGPRSLTRCWTDARAILVGRRVSDIVLKLIPADPGFVPTTAVGDACLRLLEQLVGPHDFAEATTFDEVMFIDAGECEEAGVCPGCHKEFVRGVREPGSHDHLFGDIRFIGGDSFDTFTVPMPCCGRTVLFRDIAFRDGAFARYQVAVWSPEDPTPLTREQLAQLAAVLGAPVRQVWAKY